ncbi:unnamed protein product [Closterium sp. NIES-65]|nr:unnamed protein product [Closterium sp. NIES-65]
MGTRRGVMMAARAAVVALVVARCCLPLARAAPVVDAEKCFQHVMREDLRPCVVWHGGMAWGVSYGCTAWVHGMSAWHGCMAWVHGMGAWHGCMAWVHGMGAWHGCMAVEALAGLAREWIQISGTRTWMRGRDCDSMDAVECDGDGHIIALFIVGCKGSLVSPLPTALLALSHLKTLSTFPHAPPSSLFSLSHYRDAPLKHIISNPLPPSFPSSPLSPLPALSPPCRLPFSPPCLPAHQCSSTASHGNLKASVPQELGNLQQLTRLSVRLGGGGM